MANQVKIKFDTQQIGAAAVKYREYCTEMHQIQKDLKESMERLTDKDWRGKASAKLKSIIGDDWCQTVERYCDLMTQLSTIMDEVSTTYDELLRDAQRLHLQL